MTYAYERLHQKPPKGLRIIDFVKSKKPKIVPFETKRSPTDYQRLYHLAEEILKGIEMKVFFPRASFMCKDCEYEIPCLSWQGK